MTAPFFSVLIPAYNAEKFMPLSIPSVLAQTEKDYEIIVVDNGSTDRTVEVTEKLLEGAGVAYRLVREPKNLGIGGGRNSGIRASKGKWIALLDADDRWHPNKLEKVRIAAEADSAIGVICHDENLVRVNGDAKVIGKMTYGPYSENMFEHLLWDGNCLSTSATSIRQKELEEVGLFTTDVAFFGLEDYDLWLKLSRVCKFHFLHEILGEYRVSASNTYTRQLQRHIDNEVRLVDSYIETLPAERRPGWKVRRRHAAAYCGAGWYLHRQGRFDQSREWYRKAARQDALFLKAYAAYALSLAGIRW